MPSKDKEERRLTSHRWRKKNPEKNLCSSAKQRAKRAELDFTLTPKDIIIPEFCPILQIPLIVAERSKTSNTPSVDRRDNSQGYHKENIKIISLKANRMKGDMSVEDVERLLAYMKGEL